MDTDLWRPRRRRRVWKALATDHYATTRHHTTQQPSRLPPRSRARVVNGEYTPQTQAAVAKKKSGWGMCGGYILHGDGAVGRSRLKNASRCKRAGPSCSSVVHSQSQSQFRMVTTCYEVMKTTFHAVRRMMCTPESVSTTPLSAPGWRANVACYRSQHRFAKYHVPAP